MSTLPNALATANWRSLLLEASTDDERGDTSVFPAVRRLFDPHLSSGERCKAIDALDFIEASPPEEWITRLLRGDDPMVARYALGLIPGSSTCGSLLTTAGEVSHMGDSAFSDDYKLLRRLMGNSGE